ncbi:MAG: phosphoglycerate dehydrogenase, partial [Candidatus Eremiobacteraeota bacterium]|nr:phosphoglycerate dehydrogenase [Candidatus Eremiobacteraeota bacterium]
VVIAEPFAETGRRVLLESGLQVRSCVGAPHAELLAALRDAQGLIVRSETRVDRDLIERAPNLRVIGRAGVGVDAIDVQAATQAGIVVVNTPAANTVAAVEHTFALMLSAMRHVPEAALSLREGRWERAPFVGNELWQKTLGIVGLGRIGGAIASRAAAFGMRVIAHDPYVPAARAELLGVTLVELPELLSAADIVTLHVPLTAQTRRMIGTPELARMKRSALLLNCARGGIIDETALLQALEAETIRGAAIDVIADEPPAPDSLGAQLHRDPRVLATPHLGGSTHEALARIAEELARDVAAVLRGRPAAGAVNAPAPSGADAERMRRFVALADRIGRIVPQLFASAVRDGVQMIAQGDITANDLQPLRAAFLSGLLQSTTDRRVSIVNAEQIANELGIETTLHGDEMHTDFGAVLRVSAGTHRITGTIFHSGPRIIDIDGYELDLAPEGAIIITQHRDIPGMVGRVGTILGDAGVNISTMQVARKDGEPLAVMVLAVDRAPEPDVLESLRRIAGMLGVDALSVG